MEMKAEDMWNRAIHYHVNGDCAHPVTLPDYYDDEDEHSIKSWSDHDAQKVINKLKQHGMNKRWSDMCMCPFCQFQMRKLKSDVVDMDELCADCQYGENHGKCGDDDGAAYAFWMEFMPPKCEELLKVLE